jgi:hypothetical protein
MINQQAQNLITIPNILIQKKNGLVILPLEEYKKLLGFGQNVKIEEEQDIDEVIDVSKKKKKINVKDVLFWSKEAKKLKKEKKLPLLRSLRDLR